MMRQKKIHNFTAAKALSLNSTDLNVSVFEGGVQDVTTGKMI